MPSTIFDERDERRFKDARVDQRSEGQRDRDRIIYASAFMRLSGVTQVVSPSEGFVCHTRLTHTLKVAQIARRLAEKLRKDQPDLAEALGGIDPEVAEAAALAHDLGHPPFGHIAETALCKVLDKLGVTDGYEGNAQSFRIITKLAAHSDRYRGLNLTRATLNALLKYPRPRDPDINSYDHKKYGVYNSEQADFDWARHGHPAGIRSVEAEIMDWADDIAYSVHDAEDFYRARLIPMHVLRQDGDERQTFLDSALKHRISLTGVTSFDPQQLRDACNSLLDSFPLIGLYHGTRADRAGLRFFTSVLIDKYVTAIRLASPATNAGRRVVIDSRPHMEVAVLKELTWHYVINSPTLATQQYGERKIIEGLFEICLDAAKMEEDWAMFPHGIKGELEAASSHDEATHARIVADFIASLTEDQALRLYRRLTGVSLGSVLDPL